MNLNRRSFLRSLGAALVAPLLPKVKQVDEQDRITDFLMSRDCAGSEEWRIGTPPPGTTDYVRGADPGGEDEFAVGDDYFLPNGWMRYPRADWTFELNFELNEEEACKLDALMECIPEPTNDWNRFVSAMVQDALYGPAQPASIVIDKRWVSARLEGVQHLEAGDV